jgi:hypothetical protein
MRLTIFQGCSRRGIKRFSDGAAPCPSALGSGKRSAHSRRNREAHLAIVGCTIAQRSLLCFLLGRFVPRRAVLASVGVVRDGAVACEDRLADHQRKTEDSRQDDQASHREDLLPPGLERTAVHARIPGLTRITAERKRGAIPMRLPVSSFPIGFGKDGRDGSVRFGQAEVGGQADNAWNHRDIDGPDPGSVCLIAHVEHRRGGAVVVRQCNKRTARRAADRDEAIHRRILYRRRGGDGSRRRRRSGSWRRRRACEQ